jgi:hypothetical protein
MNICEWNSLLTPPPRRILWTICIHLCEKYPIDDAHLSLTFWASWYTIYKSLFSHTQNTTGTVRLLQLPPSLTPTFQTSLCKTTRITLSASVIYSFLLSLSRVSNELKNLYNSMNLGVEQRHWRDSALLGQGHAFSGVSWNAHVLIQVKNLKTLLPGAYPKMCIPPGKILATPLPSSFLPPSPPHCFVDPNRF